MRRLALVAGLAAVGACGNQPAEVTVLAGPAVAHEVPHTDHRRPDFPDAAAGLEENLATIPPRPQARAARSRPRPAPATASAAPAGTGDTRVVSSTAYCLTGTTASGAPARHGTVAMNGVPLGSVWRVVGGGTYVVADRIGHGSGFDIAMPGDCDAAIRYGRRTVRIERVR